MIAKKPTATTAQPPAPSNPHHELDEVLAQALDAHAEGERAIQKSTSDESAAIEFRDANGRKLSAKRAATRPTDADGVREIMFLQTTAELAESSISAARAAREKAESNRPAAIERVQRALLPCIRARLAQAESDASDIMRPLFADADSLRRAVAGTSRVARLTQLVTAMSTSMLNPACLEIARSVITGTL